MFIILIGFLRNPMENGIFPKLRCFPNSLNHFLIPSILTSFIILSPPTGTGLMKIFTSKLIFNISTTIFQRNYRKKKIFYLSGRQSFKSDEQKTEKTGISDFENLYKTYFLHKILKINLEKINKLLSLSDT